MGNKTFKGRSQKDVDGKADAWLAANPALKNVQMYIMGVRAGAAAGPPPKTAGRWGITLTYDD